MHNDERLGENPKDFPTQRVALKGELRWVGGLSSRASLLLLLLCDSLVRVLRVILLAVCTREGVIVAS